ncbi:MAG: nucleotidyltransferase domain-containing protein [Candidatus Kuenenia sp.]|nr:nucleotidyltransferase domain-containing protein [Candidatus Kuenenia hertensis]
MDQCMTINFSQRKKITEVIKNILLREDKIVFAFIFGSVINAPSFRDIDIGTYVKNMNKEDVFDYECELSQKIAQECSMPFDIFDCKVLNYAPSSFLTSVFRDGILLFSRDDQLLTDLIENTSLDALSNEYISLLSLKELIPE